MAHDQHNHMSAGLGPARPMRATKRCPWLLAGAGGRARGAARQQRALLAAQPLARQPACVHHAHRRRRGRLGAAQLVRLRSACVCGRGSVFSSLLPCGGGVMHGHCSAFDQQGLALRARSSASKDACLNRVTRAHISELGFRGRLERLTSSSVGIGHGHSYPVCVIWHSLQVKGLLYRFLLKVVLLRRMQRRPDFPFEPLYKDSAPAC